MSSWQYKKKYLLNANLFILLIMCICFASIGIWLLLEEEGLLFAIIFLFISGIMIFSIISSVFLHKYVEKELTLIEFKKLSINSYSCIFYNEEKQQAISFLYSSNPCYELEAKRKYMVVLEEKKQTIMEILKPLNMDSSSFIGAQQQAVAELKNKVPYLEVIENYDEEKIQFPEKPQIPIVNEVKEQKTPLFMEVISCALYSAFAAVGAWLMHFTFVGRSNPPMFGFIMGLPFFLLPLIQIIKTIKRN